MSFKAEEIAKIVGPVPNHDVLLIGREKTNADRIRAMSDEELAFYIVNHPMWIDTDTYTAWLKSPVEVNNG